MAGSAVDVYELAIRHEREPYVLGARAPLTNAKWKGPWDCAEFASWCLYQATGVLFGVMPRHNAVSADAFTGFWADQARDADAQARPRIRVVRTDPLALRRRRPRPPRHCHGAVSCHGFR